MAIDKRDQLLYTGKGPLDAKSLVKTYAELIDIDTWTVKVDNEDTFVAYNSMIVGVWLNKDDTSKNGLYFLFDPNVTTALKKPDVTNEANWHRLDAADLADSLAAIDERLTALEESSDVVTYGYRADFPSTGEAQKLYVAADEKKTYIWFNDDYLLVSGSDNDYEEPTIIFGGTAD